MGGKKGGRVVVRIEVRNREGLSHEHGWADTCRQFSDLEVYAAEEVSLFWVQSDGDIQAGEVDQWVEKVFADPVLQVGQWAQTENGEDGSPKGSNPAVVVEVKFRPGVTDNVGRTASEALSLLSVAARENRAKVYTGKAVYLYGDCSKAQVEQVAQELFGNPLIEQIDVYSWSDYQGPERFVSQSVPEVKLTGGSDVEVISLDLEDKQLERASRDRCWALSLQELHTIRAFFHRPEVRKQREEEGLPSSPTDVEMEVLAQTWSEHCKHKIFQAEIDYTEQVSEEMRSLVPDLGRFTVKSVFKSYIKRVTEEVRVSRGLPWLVSVFTDNAGIVRFDSKVDICIKVETHNSPSALDPYGGALTGIVGVNRDVLGCGQGARPIANTDVFCFGPPDWPPAGEEKELPDGLKHPRRIFSGVHKGVEDGGNKSGIPTVNGAILFDRDYSGKPLVYCGTLGVLPAETKAGIIGSSKNQKPGDAIVMAGGRIGKDGIHGATFSSMELSEGAPATVVQIGDPITQKRLADFLLEARDLGLYSSVTDNGAGGLSSSVGEMAALSGGARLDVTHAPVKYPGLLPYELVVSESQERMTFSVPKEKLDAFMALAIRRNVEAAVLGEFTGSGFFEIFYGGKKIAHLPLDFLHDGLPPMVLKARWEGPKTRNWWSKAPVLNEISETHWESRAFHENALLTLLQSWNIRSKENWVRRYDHEVQGATVGKPFVGPEGIGPGDSGVIWLAPHGGEEFNGVAVASGIQPRFSHFDTYLMAQHSLDEAVRNLVAAGADPETMALVDNFCWPDPLPSDRNPDAAHKLAQLVRANHGIYDLAKAYGAPFVSGKDSMKNDFIGKQRFGKELKISVPPTLLVTGIARVPDVRKTISSDFKKSGDKVFLLGESQRGLGCSELSDHFRLPKIVSSRVPVIRPEKQFRLYRTIFQAAQKGLIRSCHDCSEGGLLVALAECSIGGNLGFDSEVDTYLSQMRDAGFSLAEFLFNESPGRFVVSVAPESASEFQALFSGQDILAMGEVGGDVIRFSRFGLVALDLPIQQLRKAWRAERK
jgi:phosphoribosylformylglycinamidine synthase subunit PurSL